MVVQYSIVSSTQNIPRKMDITGATFILTVLELLISGSHLSNDLSDSSSEHNAIKYP